MSHLRIQFLAAEVYKTLLSPVAGNGRLLDGADIQVLSHHAA